MKKSFLIAVAACLSLASTAPAATQIDNLTSGLIYGQGNLFATPKFGGLWVGGKGTSNTSASTVWHLGQTPPSLFSRGQVVDFKGATPASCTSASDCLDKSSQFTKTGAENTSATYFGLQPGIEREAVDAWAFTYEAMNYINRSGSVLPWTPVALESTDTSFGQNSTPTIFLNAETGHSLPAGGAFGVTNPKGIFMQKGSDSRNYPSLIPHEIMHVLLINRGGSPGGDEASANEVIATMFGAMVGRNWSNSGGDESWDWKWQGVDYKDNQKNSSNQYECYNDAKAKKGAAIMVAMYRLWKGQSTSVPRCGATTKVTSLYGGAAGTMRGQLALMVRSWNRRSSSDTNGAVQFGKALITVVKENSTVGDKIWRETEIRDAFKLSGVTL